MNFIEREEKLSVYCQIRLVKNYLFLAKKCKWVQSKPDKYMNQRDLSVREKRIQINLSFTARQNLQPSLPRRQQAVQSYQKNYIKGQIISNSLFYIYKITSFYTQPPPLFIFRTLPLNSNKKPVLNRIQYSSNVSKFFKSLISNNSNHFF